MMNSFEAAKMARVYLRNQQKMAKIVLFSPSLHANELYSTASASYNIAVENMHLFYGGKLVERNSLVALSDNSIVHVTNLSLLESKELVLIVKQIEENGKQVTFRTSSGTKVKDFIDEKLATIMGIKPNQIFLVHMGRSLQLDKTFKEQQVQNNCQLLCVKFDSPPMEKESKNDVANDDNYMVKVSVKQNSKFGESQKLSKDIYPAPNFTINVPEEMEVESTNNHLNLIFDSKMRRSSSVRGIDFLPDWIIAEEDDFSFIEQHSYRSESQHVAHEKSNISQYSQHGNESFKDHQLTKDVINAKSSRDEQKRPKEQAEDMIRIEKFKENEQWKVEERLGTKFGGKEEAQEIKYQD